MPSLCQACRAIVLAVLAGLAAALPAQAADADDTPPDQPFKFTAGTYRLTGGGLPPATALDLNLRHTSAYGNAWVGWYGQGADGPRQWRGGWDRSFDVGPLRVQPSLQVASGGFRGGSLAVETGETWFVGAGFGRTNLQPYVNLNFDPNDMVMLSAGRRWDGAALTVLLVADNRDNPDQRHLHVNWRAERGAGERLTLDLLAKRGIVDGEMTRRLGWSATYDWPRWFVRAAWDPKVNFGPQDMLRLAVGARF